MREDGKLGPYPCEEEKELSRKESELMQAYSRSILFCNLGAACFSKRGKTKEQIYDIRLERDMVWAPWMGGWICLQCYNSFCIQQYDFDVKKRDFNKEKRFLELLKRHESL